MCRVHADVHTKKSLSQTACMLIRLQVCAHERILVSKLYTHAVCVNTAFNTVLDVNAPIFTHHLLCCPSLLVSLCPSTRTHVYEIASKLQRQSGQTVGFGVLNTWFVKILFILLAVLH